MDIYWGLEILRWGGVIGGTTRSFEELGVVVCRGIFGSGRVDPVVFFLFFVLSDGPSVETVAADVDVVESEVEAAAADVVVAVSVEAEVDPASDVDVDCIAADVDGVAAAADVDATPPESSCPFASL